MEVASKQKIGQGKLRSKWMSVCKLIQTVKISMAWFQSQGNRSKPAKVKVVVCMQNYTNN